MAVTSRNSNESEGARPSSPLLIVLAWALVILPTAWGLTFTVENALKIFAPPASASSTPANPTASPAK